MIEAWREWQNGARPADDYRMFMIRELLVWLIGVPTAVALLIGLVVL